jgi:exosortase C (VPDSG-CTERM-specific)
MIMTNTTAHARPRKIFFLLFNIVALVVFYSTIKSLYTLTLTSNLYSHIPLIPAISGYLIYSGRKEIFSCSRPSYAPGIIIVVSAIILYIGVTTQGGNINRSDYLSLMTLSAVLFWVGGFIYFYGAGAFRTALFPLAFLVLMVPIPTAIAEKTISLLQHASADASYFIFKLTGVPVFREGLVFHLPGVSVEVAEQCSGIRSSIALFITTMLAGYLFLRSGSRRLILVLAIVPVTIFKNGVRIVTITLLAVYVDKSFLTNSLLHKKGGIVFFIMALAILGPLLWLLRRSEGKRLADRNDKSL